MAKSIIVGTGAALLLLGLYFAVLTSVSGWNFAREQFAEFWYYVMALTAGFGVQVGLYSYLKDAAQHRGALGGLVAVSGTTSTAAMISCCAHYLVNLIPVLGVTGLVAFVAQYQVELFWVGLFANVAGIFYIGRRVMKLGRAMA